MWRGVIFYPTCILYILGKLYHNSVVKSIVRSHYWLLWVNTGTPAIIQGKPRHLKLLVGDEYWGKLSLMPNASRSWWLTCFLMSNENELFAVETMLRHTPHHMHSILWKRKLINNIKYISFYFFINNVWYLLKKYWNHKFELWKAY